MANVFGSNDLVGGKIMVKVNISRISGGPGPLWDTSQVKQERWRGLRSPGNSSALPIGCVSPEIKLS